MIRAFRHTALAALLPLLSLGATAAPLVIPIDFTAEGTAALQNCTPQPGCTPQPLLVTQSSNLFFQNAWAWDSSVSMGWGGINDPAPDPNNTGGFLINRNRATSSTGDLTITLQDPSLQTVSPTAHSYPGQFFDRITFSLFTSAAAPTIEYRNAQGVVLGTKNLTAGDSSLLWNNNNEFTFDVLDEVRTLTFKTNDRGVLGIDNLRVTLSDATTGDVPEPAGFALVGLALLAAGAATRRSRG